MVQRGSWQGLLLGLSLQSSEEAMVFKSVPGQLQGAATTQEEVSLTTTQESTRSEAPIPARVPPLIGSLTLVKLISLGLSFLPSQKMLTTVSEHLVWPLALQALGLRWQVGAQEGFGKGGQDPRDIQRPSSCRTRWKPALLGKGKGRKSKRSSRETRLAFHILKQRQGAHEGGKTPTPQVQLCNNKYLQPFSIFIVNRHRNFDILSCRLASFIKISLN